MTKRQTSKRRPSATKPARRVQKQQRHYLRLKPYWPYVPVLLILGFGLLFNSRLAHAHRSVLGYATDMSIQSLLDDTNQQRADNGEDNLALNAQLDQAAQAKANDMAARDYWSHDTPDGQTPWSFIIAAGYSYATAGENLAYGFTSAADTITGWMNSPEHRANILNTSFIDVGFGVINIADYQNTGPETLVVAMYASPAAIAAAPVHTPAPTQTSHSASQVQAAPAAAPTPAPATTVPATAVPTTKQPAKSPVATASSEPAPQKLSRIQLVAGGQAGAYAVSLLALATIAFFILRHSLAWHRALRRGERFVLHHPALDAAAATIVVLCLLLGQTIGLVR